MRTAKIALASATAFLLAACVPSLHPLFTPNDLTFDPKLVGTWVEEGEKDSRWTLRKSEDNRYELIFVEKGEKAELDARLVRLGRFLFLDLYPQETDMFRIPAHTFVRIWIERDDIRAAMLDPEWLKDMLSKKKVSLAHHLVPDRGIMLTASTKELQEFVVKYAEDAKAFPPKKMRRRT